MKTTDKNQDDIEVIVILAHEFLIEFFRLGSVFCEETIASVVIVNLKLWEESTQGACEGFLEAVEIVSMWAARI